jgi:hypothetical protein
MSLPRFLLKWSVLLSLFVLGILGILTLIPIRPTIPPIQPRETTRYWSMSGGYRLAYTHIPSPTPAQQPPIVFLHGGPGGYVHSSTIGTLGRLTELGRAVYLYDQSGTGLSDRRRPKATTFDSHLDDLREILSRRIGAPQAVLIGHSYGGQLAAPRWCAACGLTASGSGGRSSCSEPGSTTAPCKTGRGGSEWLGRARDAFRDPIPIVQKAWRSWWAQLRPTAGVIQPLR